MPALRRVGAYLLGRLLHLSQLRLFEVQLVHSPEKLLDFSGKGYARKNAETPLTGAVNFMVDG